MSDHFVQTLMYGSEIPSDRALPILGDDVWEGREVVPDVYLQYLELQGNATPRFFLNYRPMNQQPLSDGPREVQDPWIVIDDLGSTYNAREALIEAAVKLGIPADTLRFSWCLHTSLI